MQKTGIATERTVPEFRSGLGQALNMDDNNAASFGRDVLGGLVKGFRR